MGERVVLISQARMSSTRLPGKVLMEVCGKPLLGYQIPRMTAAAQIDCLVVATSEDPADEQIVSYCEKQGVSCFRGSLDDVLARYQGAAEAHDADTIVRITSDCPLVDPTIIDMVIERHRCSGADYTSNTLKRFYPRGLDVEVFSRKALEEAHRHARHRAEREHVTPFIYGRPKQFKLESVEASENLSHHRWTVDTSEDLLLVSKILEILAPKNPLFTMEDVLALLDEHPDWVEINVAVKQKKL